MNIYLDLETVPGQHPSVLESIRADAAAELEAIRAPSNYKDQAKIDEYVASKRAEIEAGIDERWRKTALDGTYGQIVAAAIAIDDEPPVAFWCENWKTSEPDVLLDLFEAIEETKGSWPVFIGHNLVNFDLRFLWQRAVINGIRPPESIPFKAKPWDDKVFDTMTAWAGVGNRISMDKLCRAFGIAGKGDIDGSKVWDYVQAGRIIEVAEYCKADVERTRALHRRMTFHSRTVTI